MLHCEHYFLQVIFYVSFVSVDLFCVCELLVRLCICDYCYSVYVCDEIVRSETVCNTIVVVINITYGLSVSLIAAAYVRSI